MNPNLEARGKSLQGLMGAMDDEQVKKIPGFTITITPDGSPEDDQEQQMGQDDMGGDSSDPFEALIAKKKQEQGGF